MKIFNSLKKAGKRPANWICLIFNTASENEPAEIMVHEPIGRSPWSDEGLNSKDFKSILDTVPKTRDLHIRINSRGGDVWDGMAIKSMLDEWPKRVVCTIDGVAASTASWICLGCDEIRAAKNSQIFMHDAIALGFGNAEDLRKTADQLDTTSDQIAGMYSDKCGKPVKEMRKKMRDETLMTAEDAVKMGLVDKLTTDTAIHNFTSAELEAMKARLASNRAQNSAPRAGLTNTTQIMNREQMLALLKEHGVSVTNEMTDEQLQAALKTLLNKKPAADKTTPPAPVENPELVKLQNQISQLTEANNAAKKLRIENDVNALIANDQLPAGLKDESVKLALDNEGYLNVLKKLPSKPPGAEPVMSVLNADMADVFKGMEKHIITGVQNADRMVETAVARSAAMRNIYVKERERIVSMLNATTITIPAGLKRQVILQETLRAYSRRLLTLRIFATVYSNVPLQGTDKIDVAFFPLQTQASVDWVAGDGYVFNGTSTEEVREITVDKRKYQPIDYGSETFQRQPYFNAVQLGEMNAEKLAYDVLMDILSLVTIANYGAAVKTISPDAITSDDVIDLVGIANGLNWPQAGRGLALESTANTGLMKDDAYKLALNVGGTEVLREGRLPNLSGFSYDWTAYMPNNAQNLIGFITHMSAILCAFCPVNPVPEVRAQLSAYEVVTDPQTGISMNYRSWGLAQSDRAYQVIETAYGFAKGNADALKRIESPA